MKKTFLASLLAAVVAAPLMAAAISDTYVIPAAGHTRGAGGELWQSDLQIFNPNTTAVNVDIVFVDATGTARILGNTVTVAPNAAATLKDVVGSAGGQGAIVVSGDQPFVAGSRTYATTSRGTFGESIVPAAEFIDAASPDSFISGLTSNATARTNIGVFAAADAKTPLTISITILGSDGTTLGTRALTIPAGQMMVTQMSVAAVAPGTLDGASARVHVSGGDGIATAYASVVDNATSDSTFVAGSSGVLLPGRAAAALRSHLRE